MTPIRKQTVARKSRTLAREDDWVPKDAVLTIDELVVYLKLPKSTIYKLCQEGQIPGHKVGRHWRFHRMTIDQWLRSESTAKGPRRGSKEKP